MIELVLAYCLFSELTEECDNISINSKKDISSKIRRSGKRLKKYRKSKYGKSKYTPKS